MRLGGAPTNDLKDVASAARDLTERWHWINLGVILSLQWMNHPG
jgi:hypothetical protein